MAEDDEMPIEIAAKLSVDVKELVACNRQRFPGLRVVRPAALWHGRQLGFDRFPLDLQQHVLVNTARECMAKACEGNLQHLLTLRAGKEGG